MTAGFDHHGHAKENITGSVPNGAVLVVDPVFLLRAEPREL
jgi:hypothetical protein